MRFGIPKLNRGVFAFITLLVVGSLLSAGVQAKTLSFSSYLPPAAPGSIALKKFNEAIQKDSDGDLKLDLYFSGTLTTGKTSLAGMKNGLVDGAAVVASYTPSALPLNMIMTNLSFYNKDNRVVTGAIMETVLNDCPSCLAEYKNQNVHFLGTMATSPYYMMCGKTFPDGFDAEGLRTRVPGEELSSWIKSIGAVPVHMANSEAYQGLQRHALDCALGAEVWLHDLSWNEVVKTVVDIPMGGYQGGALIALSQSVWDTLSSKQQRILEKNAMYGTAVFEYHFIEGGQKAVDEARNKHNIKFIEPSDDVIAKRKKFAKDEVHYAIQQAVSQGVKKEKAEAVVKAFQKNYKKWEALIGDKDLSLEQYTQLLIDNALKPSQD